jgi:hypothetical protein
VRFQVLTAIVFPNVATCGSVDTDWRFWGHYCLHHQDDEIFRSAEGWATSFRQKARKCRPVGRCGLMAASHRDRWNAVRPVSVGCRARMRGETVIRARALIYNCPHVEITTWSSCRHEWRQVAACDAYFPNILFNIILLKNNVLKHANGDPLADFYHIFNRWENYFCQLSRLNHQL